MDIGSVCLLGGSGFVGRSIADQATERGIRVRVLTRNAARARSLTVLPTVELLEGDPSDDGMLAAAFEGMDSVVNLIGILHESRGQPFSAVHAELPHTIGRAA